MNNLNKNKEIKIKEAIINLAKMLNKWGIDNDKWFISNRLFFSNYGKIFEDKFSQFHILIQNSAIPWHVSDINNHIIPPKKNNFLFDYLAFIKNFTAVELYAVKDKKFKKFKQNCDKINLESISFLQLNIYFQLLSEWQKLNKNGSGEDVQVKYMYFLKEIRKFAFLKNDIKMINILNKINNERNTNIELPIKMLSPCGDLRGIIKFFIFDYNYGGVINNYDILIVNHIKLEMLPYLIKARAVITPSAGITSHPAIIFREIKKPLIFNVKNIYKYFFEGDEVEIDSVNNKIKIIKPVKLDF